MIKKAILISSIAICALSACGKRGPLEPRNPVPATFLSWKF
jgi:predicted small lipoprotein YifL